MVFLLNLRLQRFLKRAHMPTNFYFCFSGYFLTNMDGNQGRIATRKSGFITENRYFPGPTSAALLFGPLYTKRRSNMSRGKARIDPRLAQKAAPGRVWRGRE